MATMGGADAISAVAPPVRLSRARALESYSDVILKLAAGDVGLK